jgi:glucosamine--fructose-6-phosphate aminotransferase (isomerizing)
MCGIVGYVGPKKVVPILMEGLKRLEYRGYDSAGIAVVDKDSIRVRRVQGKINSLETSLKNEPISGSYGIGHTRWATHGRPSEENAHPHKDCTGALVVVHNGIIENYLDLKHKLKEEGHNFITETDTEIIVHLLEKYFQGSLEEALGKAVHDLEGAYAIAALSTQDKEKVVAAKVGPPVVVVEGERIEKKAERISWSPLMIEKGGYKHFMLKEIFEQPQVIRDTLKGRVSLDSGKIFLDEIGLSPEKLEGIKKVVILACGTSYHASLVGKYFIESLAQIPVDIEYASEYRYRDFVLDSQSLVVVISQSGETADTLAALRAVKEKNPVTLAICNMVNSSITRESGGVLYTHAGPEIGVAATKTFIAQMTALSLFAIYLAQVKNTLTEEATLSLIQELQRIPHKIENILNGASSLEELAQNFVAFSHFLYLGRWVNFPVALEGALKLKEISYIHAEGYPGGEMKHGPIALIDEKMPTVAIIPKDKVYDKMLSNISEIKSRMGYILAVAFEDDEFIQDKVDDVITIPPVHPLFTPFLTTVPLQLFAYYIAAIKGADVDQPRNLAKSVTVE